MKSPAISVKNIAKSYKISHELKASPGEDNFREAIVNILKKPKEILTGHIMKKEKFWALKGVSFDVQRGDIVGLIGTNGSGKSTLLKIMSRITEPTKGEIVLNGRVASLLEVGTGFHPELTGRENVYFNGSILGMKKKEIESKFDEIVEFSGVQKFLDTPVKYYSSGMYVRLAFAVAAHLEPDILIVDEVLAVGDADFQKKSLGKMKESTSDKKRTVIFVSHNMAAIRNICNKCVWIGNGEVVDFGPTNEIVRKYTEESEKMSSLPIKERTDRQGTGRARFTKLDIKSTIEKDSKLSFEVEIENNTKETLEGTVVSFAIKQPGENVVSRISNKQIANKINLTKGINKYSININEVNLVPGRYYINSLISSDSANTEMFDFVSDAGTFEVKNYDFYKTGRKPENLGNQAFLKFDYNRIK